MIQLGVVVNLSRMTVELETLELAMYELKMLELRLNSLLVEVESRSAASLSLLIATPSRTDQPLLVNLTPVSAQPAELIQTCPLRAQWMTPAQLIRRLPLQERGLTSTVSVCRKPPQGSRSRHPVS
jgi:hypothetical protein